ncbi:MAG TPA: ATP-binding protein [Syntrophales bacterium]|nr:ATP-binding protein [Syntrophales bacterium]
MQEILTAVTYLVVWLICERVIEIESGFLKLIISVGAAVGVYILIAVREHRAGKSEEADDTQGPSIIKFIKNNIRFPIWLNTVVVIVMIILFSVMINHAREKEAAEQYGKQYMAVAKGTAAGIDDLFDSVEKSLIILSRQNQGKTQLNMRMIYDDLDGKVEFIARKDDSGKLIETYPKTFSDDILKKISENPSLIRLIQDVKKTGKPSVSDLISFDYTASNGSEKKYRMVIIGVPEFNANSKYSGILYSALSLSSIVERYIKLTKDELPCDAIIADEKGTLLFHPRNELAGTDISTIEHIKPKQVTSLKDGMLKDKAGYGEYELLEEKGKFEKNIVAYAPIDLDGRKWFIAVTTPYNVAISHMQKTFYIVMLEALVLIATVIIGSSLIFYAGKKRLILEEELKHLREEDKLKEQLTREKKTMEGIIEGSPIPTFVIDREHKIIFWNHACKELTGLDVKDMIGTDGQYKPFYSSKRPVIADLIVDNNIEELNKYYEKKSMHKSTIVEGAYEASDYFENLGGKGRYLYFLAAPIYNEKGEIIAAIETLQDVTKEEQMTRNMKEYAESLSNEIYELIRLRTDIEELYNYLQSILDSSPDRIFALSPDGIVNYVSHSSEADNGSTPRQMEGSHFTEFIVPEYREFMLDKWEEIKKGIHKPFEIEVTAKDGSKRNLLITSGAIKGTDRYLLVQRDITEFKNLEKKFYESQKLAAVGQLSAGIAHEVRNPLSSIKMSLRILEKRLNPIGNDLRRFRIAEKEVEHLEKIVNDILIYAKPAEPEVRPADISSFLESSLMMVEKELSEKKIDVQFHNDPGIPPINLDSAMLKQAFLNIYLNAIDAMESGGRLQIRTKVVGNGHRHVLIEIEDNGYGIEEEDMPHLFNPFFTRKKYGTGLGLTQVKKFIDLHHGNIEILSKKGAGTRVIVTLPLEVDNVSSETPVNDTEG